MNELIKQLLPDLTWAIFWLFLIGVVVLVIAGTLLLKNIQTYAREKAAALATDFDGDEKKSWLDRLRGMTGFFSRFTSLSKSRNQNLFGETKDEAAQSFDKAIEVLQGYFGPKEAQYHLPWYLVVGCEGAGKTSFLEDANLELPIGNPVDELTSPMSPLHWRFFDQGVVAEVRGDLLLSKEGTNSDEGQWTYILNLFKFHRPKRPIDGIILTIPSTEVAGPDQLSKEDIAARGRAIYSKLWKMQNTLGMRVPIYIVVTKSDQIPGFSSIVAQIPDDKRQEMLGWSSPYDIHTAFTDEWIEVMFRHLRGGFNKLRSAIFTRDLVEDRRTGAALFPLELSAMKETLGLYLTSIFKESSYHDSFFLRGVYFTGYGDSPDIIDFLQKQRASGTVNQIADPTLGRIVFVKDLLAQKVFQEYPICEPNTRLLTSTNQALNVAKVVGAVLSVVWFFGLINAYNNLKYSNDNLYASLHVISDAILGVSERSSAEQSDKLGKYLDVQAERVLSEFIKIDFARNFSIFVPASWFSILNANIEMCFTAAYDRIIFPAFSTALRQRIVEVVSKDQGIQAAAKSNQAFPNPTSSPSFKRLEAYLNTIEDLEANVMAFNRLKTSLNLQDIGRLSNYLFGRELPLQFYTDSDYYRNALAQIFGEQIDVMPAANAAQEKLRILYRNFLSEALDVQQNLPVLLELQKDLTAVVNASSYRKMDEKDLRQLTEKIISFADLAVSGKLAWLSKQLFDPGKVYDHMMDQVVGSALLGRQVASDLGFVANLAFSKYRLELAGLKADLVGTFFTVENGQLLSEPSSGVVDLIDALTSFLNEPFMVPVENYQILFKLPPGKLLFWDAASLSRAVTVVASFDDFASKKLTTYPTALQEIFKEVGRNGVRKKVANYVALAQSYEGEPSTMTSFGARELLAKQVTNIATATPLFAKILSVFDGGGAVIAMANLRELLINQNYNVLEKINNLLAIDNLYSANQEELRWWKGDALVGFKLFNVSDGNDMNAYLTAQRMSIIYLANEMAKPTLGMLAQPFLKGVPMDMPLVTKWTRIVSVLEDYEKKVPGNSLQVLEQFLKEDLNSINVENCLEKVGDFDRYAQTGDYFLDVRNHYFEAVEKQCEGVGFKDAVEKYNRASTFFNANLAGRFPFTKELGNEPEANPGDVATFFSLFDALTAQQLEMLKMADKHSGALNSVAKFITDIRSIRPILLPALASPTTAAISKINLMADFRTDQEREQGGENIIDWSMNVSNAITTMRDSTPIVEWRVGMPINMMIKWASNGETLPMPDPRLQTLNVTGSHAVFSYEGRWALVRLLREHAMPDLGYDSKALPGSQLLEFVIPTAFNPNQYREKDVLPFERQSQPVKIYMRLTLGSPTVPSTAPQDPKAPAAPAPATVPPGEEKNKIITVPVFPYTAPLHRAG